MSPIENPTDEDWHLIGSDLTTQREKTRNRRGRANAAKGLSKKCDVALQRDNVDSLSESASKG
jgi:hypothetical protein